MGNSIIQTGLIAKDYAQISLGVIQNSNFANGNHIEFDTVVGNLALSTGAGQTNGLVTLLAGRKYKLQGFVFLTGGAANCAVDYQWFDVTNGVFIGEPAQAIGVQYTTDSSFQPAANALITTATNIQVELRIIGNQNVTSFQAGYTNAYIESIEAYVPSVATFPVKAWVSFDASSAAPAITVLNSFNVAAVNYISLGIYQIVFATPMPNVNYATFCTATMTGSGTLNSAIGLEPTTPQTINDVTVTTKRSDATLQDEPVVNVMVLQ